MSLTAVGINMASSAMNIYKQYVSIWGTNSFPCVNTVQNRASCYCMVVGKYTPNGVVVQGDMATSHS